MPWLAVGEEHRNGQTSQHTESRDAHRHHDVDIGNIKAGVFDVAQQNVVQEDRTESDRNPHVRGDQTEGHHTGYHSAVDVETVKYRQ